MSDQQQPNESAAAGSSESKVRKQALKRIQQKRAFWRFVGLWLIISIGMVVIWALSGRGYFWPAWVFFGMGIAVIAMGWGTYGPRNPEPSEDQIQAEIDKMK